MCVCMSVCMDAPSRQLTACASPGSRSNTEFDYQSCSKTSNATAIVATLVGLLVAVIFFFVWLVVQHQVGTSYLAYHQQVRSSEHDKTCVGTRACIGTALVIWVPLAPLLLSPDPSAAL